MADTKDKNTCVAHAHPGDTRDGLPLLHGANLSFSFGGKTPVFAVQDVDFGIEKGQIASVIGESGSGKSTLLKLVYGLLEPTGGEIRYAGTRVPPPSERLIPGHPAMRMVSQHFDDLNLYAKVWDNVASRLSNVDIEAKEKKTQTVLDTLRISHRAQFRVFDLSGGEKQRVAIARALLNDPAVLLLDEPFNQVDASFREQLQRDIRNIVDTTGLTVVMVSHDPEEVMALADHLLVLQSGRLVAHGTPADLYQEPPNAYTARLLAMSNILSAEEAATLGVESSSAVAIHPEWITLSKEGGVPAEVLEVRFKGFYEELLVFAKGVQLKAIGPEVGRSQKGQQVALVFQHHHPIP